MFGSCAGNAAPQDIVDEDKEDLPRRPKRYQGQKRELVVKQAERVAHHTLTANISEIERKLSDDEREYEARAEERQEEQRRREEELKEAAIEQAVSGASGQLSGNLFDRMQSLAKIRESAKSTLKLELGNLMKNGDSSARKGTPANGGSASSATNGCKMPLPAASTVVVTVTHPCYVSVLRAKLHRSLGIPLPDVRVVHRHKTLKDEDLIPDDTVDNGEQAEVEEVVTGQGLDLSYLWVVDAKNLGQRSRPSTSNAKRSSSTATKKQTTPTTDAQGRKQQTSEDERSGDGGDEETEKAQGSGSDSASPKQVGGETQGPTKSGGGESLVEPGPDGERSPPGGARDASAGGEKKAKKRTHPKGGGGNRGSAGGDGEQQQDEQQQQKKRKGRLVPGSLLLTSLSVSDLPNTEKGVFSKQDPYLVVKWGGQEARTSAKRDSGRDCSWSNEELALIVRTKKQLQEPVEIEVWNDNAGDKKPSPDVLIAKGPLPVKHLALPQPTAPASATDGNGSMKGGGRDNHTDDERGREGVVLNVDLMHGGGWGRKKKNASAGVITLTLEYIPPRRKQTKAEKEEDDAAAARGRGEEGDQAATDTDDDGLSSIAGLSALSSLGKKNNLSVQELGAAMSQALEGFDVREELNKIGCLRYAQGIINEGFGQRGAFADIQEKHLVGHPIYVPRGARKRILTLAELVRLQMKAEASGVTKAKEAITSNGEGAFEGGYTVDGVVFFDTLAAMKLSLEEDKIKAELAIANESIKNEKDLLPRPKSPKPRSAAKQKVIRAIEATAEAEERGIFRTPVRPDGDGHGERNRPTDSGINGEDKPCCEKHAFQLERSSVHMLEERVRDTLGKVDVWLDHADRFKNGAIPLDAVKTVTRDALLLNGLPSPRESDARISLQHASIDNQGLHFDRSKLGVELEHLIRKELFFR